MVVDNLLVLLLAENQAVRTGFVDESGTAGRITMDFSDGSVGEDLGLGAGHLQVVQDIGLGFSFIEVRKMAADVEPLQDGCIHLSAQFVPDLGLAISQ